MLTTTTINSRRGLGFALILALLALMSSVARAAICAAAVIVLTLAGITVVPQQSEALIWDGSISVIDLFVFKGKPHEGAFGSRKGPWQASWEVIRKHRWFASGFGTSETGEDLTNVNLKLTGTPLDTRVVREHGNSYLAIAEWGGLLGVLCVLVWAMAFILKDLVRHDEASVHAPEPSIPVYWNDLAPASPRQ